MVALAGSEVEMRLEEEISANKQSVSDAQPRATRASPGVDLDLVSVANLRKEITELRAAEKLPEAVTKIKYARELWPNEEWPYLDLAWLMRNASDWAAADEVSRECRSRFPMNETGYMVGVAALRELGDCEGADNIAVEAIHRFGSKSWIILERAELAFRAGQTGQSIQFWKEFLALEPDSEHGYRRASQISIARFQWGEAEAFLNAAINRLPEPGWAYIELARSFMLRGDYKNAEYVLLLGVEAIPSDKKLNLELGISSVSAMLDVNRDVEKSTRRLRAYRLKFPDDPNGWVTEIRMLRRAKMLDRAQELTTEALQVFPDCDVLLVESARLHHALGTNTEALDILCKAAASNPNSLEVQIELAQALLFAELVQRAAELLAVCCKKWPGSADLERLACVVGNKTLPPSAALERWIAAAGRFPHDGLIADALYAARMSIGEGGVSGANLAPHSEFVSKAPVEYDKLGELFSRFESLGGTGQGCEFGIVQRRAGVEPLGLLRWTNITVENLTRGLNEDFNGVGTSEQTKVEFFGGARQGDDPEYVLDDLRYRMRMHTFIRKSESGENRIFNQMQRRLTFLRRKLLEDLESGEKIYVFKQFERVLSDVELNNLVAALSRHGKNKLLYVRIADGDHQPGTALMITESLIVGYISQFSMAPSGEARPPQMEEWTAICEQAAALVRPT